MKILFLCGSLEHGRDGVGDYVRRLAGQLTSKGHTVAAAAMYDSFVDIFSENSEYSTSGIFKFVRIPVTSSSKSRFGHISNLIGNFYPEWISLQYVGFGFHRYGLPWDIIFFLSSTINNIKLHIMLHELWCGMPEEASSKEKLLGSSQKIFLKLMLGTIKPSRVSTSNSFYASQLKNIHIKSNVIPIFGNIPLDCWGTDDEWVEITTQAGLAEVTGAPGGWLILGFFGAVYACPGLAELLQHAAAAALQKELKLGLLAFGNNGARDISVLAKNVAGGTCWKAGMLSPAMINRVTNLLSAGVVTTPANRLSKSGAAAALLERSIPLLVSHQDKTYNEAEMVDKGIYQVNNEGDVLRCIAAKGKLPKHSSLEAVAEFYESLAQTALI